MSSLRSPEETEHDNILLLTPWSNISLQNNIFQHPFCGFLKTCQSCWAQIFYIVGNPSIFHHKYESRKFMKYLFLCHSMLAVQLTLLLLAFFIPEVSPPEKVCIQVPSRYLIHLVLRWQKYFCLRAVWEELCIIKEEDEYNNREIDSSGISTKGSGEAPLWTVQHCWGCCGFFISQEGLTQIDTAAKKPQFMKIIPNHLKLWLLWSLVRSVIGITL